MSSPTKPDFDRALLTKFMRGAQKVFANAEALNKEAKVLAATGATSRALFLHQISLEECAKIQIIGPWLISLVAGLKVDEKKIIRALANHAGKNRTNAYLLAGSPEEQAAKARGDWEAALVEFRKLQSDFHESSNEAKNAALYVDFQQEEFVAPDDRITPEMLAEIAERNTSFLDMTGPYLRLLVRWDQRPDDAAAEIGAFVELAGTVRGKKPDEQMAAFADLIDRVMADYQARG